MSLNFKEKRALQKTVTEQQAALRGGSLGFKEKREAQKLLRDALAKLGAGVPAQVEIPPSVKSALDLLIAPLAEIARGLESARATDRRFSAGDGRYAGEFMSSEGTVEKLNAAEKAISDRIGSIPDAARRAAAEAYVRSNRPDLILTDAEREWAGFDPAPVSDSPFAPLLAGDFNRLPVPEFVTRLEGAYSEEEDLEKAKQAAIQYLEANRETLEAA